MTLKYEAAVSKAPDAKRRVGWEFIAGALLVNLPYALLIANFDYPDILRQPAAEILTRFREGGPALIWQWLAFAWAGFPILLAVIGLHGVLKREGHPLLLHATVLGVAGLLVQIVGLSRWVFVVPGLAETYTDPASSPAAQEAALVVFQAVHQFGGVLLGEHLGQLLTVVWMVLVSGMMLRSRLFRPWLGWFGFAAAGVYLLAQGELFATVMPGFPVWGLAGLLGSLLWLAWLVAIGVSLVRSKAD